MTTMSTATTAKIAVTAFTISIAASGALLALAPLTATL